MAHNEKNSRSTYILPNTNYLNNLRLIGESISNLEFNFKILFCNEISNSEETNEIRQYFKSSNVNVYNYTQSIDGIDLFSNVYQLCIMKDFESHFHLIPQIVQLVQENGVVLFISREISIEKNKIDFNLSSFSKRFYNQITKKCNGIITEEINEINLKNFLPVNQIKTRIPEIENIDSYPIELCRTMDQKHALEVLTKSFEDSFSSSQSPIKSSVTIIEGLSGRGKASAIILGIASAIKFGLSDIYVMGPHITALRSSCDYLSQILVSMGFNESVIRVRYLDQYFILEVVAANITQKVRFITFNQEFSKYDTSLLCILEAGQLPIGKVSRLLSFNPKLIWVSVSTGGYNSIGTHVYNEICQTFQKFLDVKEVLLDNIKETVMSQMVIREMLNKSDHKMYTTIYMNDPIIFKMNDTLEKCMNDVFCLQRNIITKSAGKNMNLITPDPSKCQLMYIDKRTLFSGHLAAEVLLEKFMSIYTSFDTKRTGVFLKELANEPAQQLFCLQYSSEFGTCAPEIICIAHVSYEQLENKNAQTLMDEMKENSSVLKNGNSLRIVKLITQDKFQKLGYGRHMLKMLHKYFLQKPLANVSDHVINQPFIIHRNLDLKQISDMPKLLIDINELPPTPFKIDYISCQFLANFSLLCFWKKCNFYPVQIRATSSSQMLCTMIRDCTEPGESKLSEAAYQEMCENIGQVLLRDLRDVDVNLAHEILFHKNKFNMTGFKDLTVEDLSKTFDNRQLKKLDSFVQNIHSFESVHDIVFYVAQYYFSRRLSGVHLSKYQELALVGFGLQLKSTKQLATEMILMERYQSANFIDPFNLRKDVQKRIPLLLSHIKECTRVFLNHVTKLIDQFDNDEVAEKRRKLM